MSGQDSRLRGRWGEDRAAEYLGRKGFRLVATNWRCRFGELDLVRSEEHTSELQSRNAIS